MLPQSNRMIHFSVDFEGAHHRGIVSIQVVRAWNIIISIKRKSRTANCSQTILCNTTSCVLSAIYVPEFSVGLENSVLLATKLSRRAKFLGNATIASGSRYETERRKRWSNSVVSMRNCLQRFNPIRIEDLCAAKSFWERKLLSGEFTETNSECDYQ